jgi:hypothetical protein
MPPSIPNEQTRESESDLEPTGEVVKFVCVRILCALTAAGTLRSRHVTFHEVFRPVSVSVWVATWHHCTFA